jgi:DNA modification methylase
VSGRVIILRSDAASLPLADESVDLIVTSPPYWGLRDYRDGGESLNGQIGSEATPAEWLEALVACTREWMRVLKPEGSMFVDLGDKYSARADGSAGRSGRRDHARVLPPARNSRSLGREKSLLLLPERYRIACADQLGLIVRAKIVWSKLTPMPESAGDRVQTAHEDVVHLTKNPRYFSAVDEIRIPHTGGTHARRKDGKLSPKESAAVAAGHRRGFCPEDRENPLGKLPGSVWEIPSQPLIVPADLGVDHFAAFPMELPRRIILGWSPSGICMACGEGRRPVATSVALDMNRPQARRAQQLADRAGLTEDHLQALLSVGLGDTGRSAATQAGTGKSTPAVYALAAEARAVLGGYAREYLLRRPTRFAYTCACPDTTAQVRPAVVADPFGGTGTTALVASMLGRLGVTVDRSADYCRVAAWRTADPAERARALGVPKPPPVSDGQGSLFDALEAS